MPPPLRQLSFRHDDFDATPPLMLMFSRHAAFDAAAYK